MDELDREIKTIQLQRERIALQKELERQRLKERFIALPDSIFRKLTARARSMARFMYARWRSIVALVLVSVACLAVVIWREEVKYTERQEREAALRDESARQRAAAVEAKCGRLCGKTDIGDMTIDDRGVCTQRIGFSHVWCRRQVELGAY